MSASGVLDLVKAFEGFHRVVKGSAPVMAGPYLCPARIWTIGYGHVCPKDHAPIGMPAAEAYLAGDLEISARSVRRLVKRNLTAGQFGALVSWTFNLGAGRLQASTLLRVINAGELERAPDEMRKWIWGGGQRLPGLVARREAEVTLFLS